MASSSNDAGGEFIPASKRPDGTWRKERRVKAGYVPPDEVKKYESKATRFNNEKEAIGIPGLAPSAKASAGGGDQKMTKNQKKNERKKQKKKEEYAATANEPTVVKTQLAPVKKTKAKDDSLPKEMAQMDLATNTKETSSVIDKDEVARKIKSVRKKLKQCDQILERKKKGEQLEKEQTDKLNKKSEFEKELKELQALL